MPKLVRPIEGNRFVDPGRELLVHVARKFRRMGKLGLNLESAAEVVGGDVLGGRIGWWSEPPQEEETESVVEGKGKGEKRKVRLGGKKKLGK